MKSFFPERIGAGLTFQARATLTAYPAPGWVLSAILRGPAAVTLAAHSEGCSHEFNATAEQTAEWIPGVYSYSIRAAKNGAVAEVEAGTIEVTPDIASAEGDQRSQNRRTLDAIRAVIEQRASLDQQEYRINNRELKRMTIDELMRFERVYASRVRAENARLRGVIRFGGSVKVNF